MGEVTVEVYFVVFGFSNDRRLQKHAKKLLVNQKQVGIVRALNMKQWSRIRPRILFIPFYQFEIEISITDDVLLFFKHYDPVEKTLSCVGHLYIPLSTKFGKWKYLCVFLINIIFLFFLVFFSFLNLYTNIIFSFPFVLFSGRCSLLKWASWLAARNACEDVWGDKKCFYHSQSIFS